MAPGKTELHEKDINIT